MFPHEQELEEELRNWAKEQPDKPWVFTAKERSYPLRITVVTYYDESAILLRFLYGDKISSEES